MCIPFLFYSLHMYDSITWPCVMCPCLCCFHVLYPCPCFLGIGQVVDGGKSGKLNLLQQGISQKLEEKFVKVETKHDQGGDDADCVTLVELAVNFSTVRACE